MYRVLAIAGAKDGDGGPIDIETELSLLGNISDQFTSMHVDLLEQTSELGIAEKLALSTEKYDAIHFLGHADDNGFFLSADEYLTASRIQKLCLDSGARTVFLNSCISGRIGQYLVNNKMAVALCYSVPVFDRDALLCALRFYSTLAKSNDPFEDGLREAYNAADPGDGSLLWLTNGQYVAEIIRPITARLDAMSGAHTESFSSFSSLLSATKSSMTRMDHRLSRQVARLTTNTQYTRYALVLLIIIVALAMFLMSLSPTSQAKSPESPLRATGTVEEPLLEITKIPPKNTHAAWPTQPTKKPTSTDKPGNTIPPTQVAPTSTWTLEPVATLAKQPTSTWTTVGQTIPPAPTSTNTVVPAPFQTHTPTSTFTPVPKPTETVAPPLPTSTWTPSPC